MSVSSDEVQEFLGRPTVVVSEAMSDALALARRVARTSVSVLIRGETGTGKEHIARAIHHYSLRCAMPWVDVNCASLPEHLVESELFGYERGAFSGAVSTKQGLFELAHRGTILLDEVGELDPKMQVKLLRVLDGTPYYRLGGTRKVSVDVRVLAATNLDLETAMQEGRFRKDLYHRLSQVTIHVPSLRDRIDDIIPLAEYFIREHRPEAYLCPRAEDLLRSWDWPGNVRELRNAVINAAILSDTEEIQPEMFSLAMPCPLPGSSAPPRNGHLSLDGLEREAILQALAATGGHHQRAAEKLGISRRTLSRKLRVYRAEQACPAPA
jgi:transcriptional regulator with PAS, ATPase and Fis domain